MKKVNVALVGAGYIADYHARGLQSLADVEIVSVVGLPLESAKEFAKKYGIEEATSNIEDLYSRADIDAVVIGTPNKFHAPFAIDFLKNGKDVFLEKPMAMNSEEGISVIDAAKENNQLVMVGHMWRFDKEVDSIKEIVSSAKIGKIIKTKGYGIHENWGPEGWFTKKELAGGGALADMGVHAIDTVRYILGDPKPKEVYAKIGTHFGNYDVDDSGIVMITWDNGTTSIIESGWWQPHMDGPEASTQLFGTKGYASLFPTKVKFSSKDDTVDFKLPEVNKSEHCDQSIYSSQMEYFVNCVRDRIQPSPGFEEGLVVLNIVDAAYKSAETGLAVKL